MTAVLTLEQVSVGFTKELILQDISLEINPGDIVGLIGPNGAGKSTLMRTIGGTIKRTSGRIQLNGTDLSRLSVRDLARHIAVVPQRAHLPEAFTVLEVVMAGRTPYLPLLGGERKSDYEVVYTAMERTATLGLAERRVGEISGGEQQRVLIARALAQEPRILLLDEATAHLDLRYQIATLDLIRELSQTGLIVIAVLHDMNLAALYANRLALLHQGRLLAYGSPNEVLTTAWLQCAFQVQVVVQKHPLYDIPMVALAPTPIQAEAIIEEPGRS